jgi:glycine/D-amino acid oxidase-like deaminating enzyme
VVSSSADVVVCGAGIAGVSVAFHLAVRQGVHRVLVVDPRPPLTLTSDKSTECYRNWWPGPGSDMVAFMNRSIDLLEEMAAESADAFRLTRRGYLYVTADPSRLEALRRSAEEISRLGAGELRVHGEDAAGYLPSPSVGWMGVPGGADLLVGGGLHRRFPYLCEQAVGALHVRRAGWVSAQQLGAWMLERARDAGATLVPAEVTSVEVAGGRVEAVGLEGGERVRCGAFVNAAGPMFRAVGRLVGEDLPVHSEVHHKVAFRDVRGALPREAPMVIWHDPQRLAWSDEERAALEADPATRPLAGELPAACHGRPEGGSDSPWVVALWEYSRDIREPEWPLPEDPLYPEVVLRGMTTMVPALAGYLDHLPKTVVDGGYYTKTPENRPLAGSGEVEGSFLAGALSGFGVMAAPAAGDLVARSVVGAPLPDDAGAFRLDRYRDPAYRALMAGQTDSGQL